MTDRQLKILRLIDYGRGRMDYLIDAFGIDSTLLNQDVECLEQNGYISRLSGTGYGFFSFALLPPGEAVLSPKPPEELQLREDHLMVEELKVLRFVREHPGCKFRGHRRWNRDLRDRDVLVPQLPRQRDQISPRRRAVAADVFPDAAG